MSAGLDFETKVLVKHRAPDLLREFLAKPSWKPEMIAFSGVTDCYQPAEREFRITRGCVAVAAEFNQPIGIITKNALVCRDIDLLQKLADHQCGPRFALDHDARRQTSSRDGAADEFADSAAASNSRTDSGRHLART